jgi:hypothetical protein
MSFGGGVTWKLGDVDIAKVLQSTQRARTGAGTAMYTAPDVLLAPHDGRMDVFSVGIVAAELVVRHMDIAGFERVPTSKHRLPERRPALVEDACARLNAVCPALSAVVRHCSAMKAKHRMSSDVALRALDKIDLGGGGGGVHLADGCRGIASHVIAMPHVRSFGNGVAVSRDGSTLLVSDFDSRLRRNRSDSIHEFRVSDGYPLRVIGGAGDGRLQFRYPAQVWLASDDFAFVAEYGNNRVQGLPRLRWRGSARRSCWRVCR